MPLRLSLLLLLSAAALVRPTEVPLEAELRARLAVDGPILVAGEPRALHADLRRFYAARGYAPAWTGGGADLVPLLHDARHDGLDPEAYGLATIEALLHTGPAADLDLLATDAFLRLGEHLLRGRVDPRTLARDWHPTLRQRDLAGVLAAALASGDLVGALDGLRPPHPEYATLRRALAAHHAGRTAPLPDVDLAPGQRGPAVGTLRQRLRLSGDLADAPAVADDLFDEALAGALRRFQARHGLAATGVLGSATRRALDAPPPDARRLILNLERWRWLPDDLGGTHLIVNLPAQDLRAREDGETVFHMRAVIGKARTRTPVLSDTLRSLTFNPTWAVPRSIVAAETIPDARAQGASYLVRHGYTVFHRGRVVSAESVDWSSATVAEYGFIQGPGPSNPMGRVKFNLGNPFDIYLHDTNQPSLLQRQRRAESAGCVRLEQPLELARWMLRHWSDWQPEDVARRLASRETVYVAPRDRWDVHLVYFTAWPDESGAVTLHDDVYGHDALLARTLGL